jgi:hypothetical protein
MKISKAKPGAYAGAGAGLVLFDSSTLPAVLSEAWGSARLCCSVFLWSLDSSHA